MQYYFLRRFLFVSHWGKNTVWQTDTQEAGENTFIIDFSGLITVKGKRCIHLLVMLCCKVRQQNIFIDGNSVNILFFMGCNSFNSSLPKLSNVLVNLSR